MGAMFFTLAMPDLPQELHTPRARQKKNLVRLCLKTKLAQDEVFTKV